ncbi:uncharacterized protein BO80DRAFT_440387 [Aspergillus ibericus CBS 121593]|uniref:Uncharacterized protein n=1 Tax=Aspergillus ibericus CBS 121593 TaxID=1448316 RepID=A0A395HH93_9EURO|nr:hypothetical protein BO80DRAFT_440387 [Aspergillus ibericus CBS 121593]RAL05614.1 hypothetical protein BO80DRAFT_440387 [Aspergillus ibericus CBS 121593]
MAHGSSAMTPLALASPPRRPLAPIGPSPVGGARARSFLFPRAFPPSLPVRSQVYWHRLCHYSGSSVRVNCESHLSALALRAPLAVPPATILFPAGSASTSPRLFTTTTTTTTTLTLTLTSILLTQ